MTKKSRTHFAQDLPRSSGPRTWARLLIVLLGVVGAGVSAYLVYAHYQQITTACFPGMECDDVLSSEYAQIWGVPLAMLGLVAYVAVAIIGNLLWRGPVRWQPLLALAAYTIALSATLFSLYLYYLEMFEIRAFCAGCVVSSLVSFGLLGLTSAILLSPSSQRSGVDDGKNSQKGHAGLRA